MRFLPEKEPRGFKGKIEPFGFCQKLFNLLDKFREDSSVFPSGNLFYRSENGQRNTFKIYKRTVMELFFHHNSLCSHHVFILHGERVNPRFHITQIKVIGNGGLN
jgi:hypothetical protein